MYMQYVLNVQVFIPHKLPPIKTLDVKVGLVAL